MNVINPNKLYHRKWTSTAPTPREKHFIVNNVSRDEHDNVIDVVLEAVLSNREFTVPWRELKDEDNWQMGWK